MLRSPQCSRVAAVIMAELLIILADERLTWQIGWQTYYLR